MTNPPPSATPPPGPQQADRSKSRRVDENRVRPYREALRTNQGVRVAGNQNMRRAGARGTSLLEDFIVREKIAHLDHERIAEWMPSGFPNGFPNGSGTRPIPTRCAARARTT